MCVWKCLFLLIVRPVSSPSTLGARASAVPAHRKEQARELQVAGSCSTKWQGLQLRGCGSASWCFLGVTGGTLFLRLDSAPTNRLVPIKWCLHKPGDADTSLVLSLLLHLEPVATSLRLHMCSVCWAWLTGGSVVVCLGASWLSGWELPGLKAVL